jgi:propionyl-CoA carboxylase beta chain
VNILYRKQNLTDEQKKEKVEEYKRQFASPYRAAELGYVDEIIYPRLTRLKLVQALDMTQNKTETIPPKKHGNIPL